mmetsp:Transcript_84838/g.236187  ORF Transcript_84838/g.236187 Transcript_84838/m.236187 type:complete len:381 (-) Transcript_84838:209-1351(-)
MSSTSCRKVSRLVVALVVVVVVAEAVVAAVAGVGAAVVVAVDTWMVVPAGCCGAWPPPCTEWAVTSTYAATRWRSSWRSMTAARRGSGATRNAPSAPGGGDGMRYLATASAATCCPSAPVTACARAAPGGDGGGAAAAPRQTRDAGGSIGMLGSTETSTACGTDSSGGCPEASSQIASPTAFSKDRRAAGARLPTSLTRIESSPKSSASGEAACGAWPSGASWRQCVSSQQSSVATIGPAQGLPLCSSRTLFRERWRSPWWQDTEQRDHGCQSSQWQSIGQGSGWQSWFSVLLPSHWRPSALACTSTLRRRTADPPPQEVLHWAQSPQSAQTQSTGQGCVLHRFQSTLSPMQGLPLPDCSTSGRRRASCQPPPHVALHSV